MKLTVFSIALAGLVVGGLFAYQQNRPDFHLQAINETLHQEPATDAALEDISNPANLAAAQTEAELESASIEQADTLETEALDQAKL